MFETLKDVVFPVLGGLGIFLFGIKFMGDGLKNIAGSKIRDFIDRFTTNPVMGALVGIIVTVLIQSSSGTTALTIGLVAAGLMTLRQSIAVIIGANVGTTITSVLIGLKIGDYALPIIFVGAILLMFFSSKKVQYWGQTVFGFGALFFGLKVMGGPLKELADTQAFEDAITRFADNPWLALVAGTVVTFIVQSSSATIGILQTLYAEGALSGGVFDAGESLKSAIPILFGANIGTTITAVLASLGASRIAKRAALSHVIFNVSGAILFMIILSPFTWLVLKIINFGAISNEIHIAYAHGIFNITMLIIALPFVKQIAMLVTKIIPISEDEREMQVEACVVTKELLEQSPSLALTQVNDYVKYMSKISYKQLVTVKKYFETKDIKYYKRAGDFENIINDIDKKIHKDLVLLTEYNLSLEDSVLHNNLMQMIRDFERIGDHAENLSEYFYSIYYDSKEELDNETIHEYEYLLNLVIEMFDKALKASFENDVFLAEEVFALEKQVDELENKFRKNYVNRMKNKGKKASMQSIYFVDILSNLERIADHANNIAGYALSE